MDNPFANIDSITRQLKSMERRKKPKMLVVDDEPDNLDLLYRTFRRNFQVFKADSGVNALEILSQEGEVAVIISDQRMPEMKGTEFLSKTVPEFPDTVRIILTGFTDVEDLVEAINSGQVYKYITKPWDPNELKAVVDRAAETYEILKQRTEELQRAEAQTELLAAIVEVAQNSDSVAASLKPIATAFGKSFGSDGCILNLFADGTLTAIGQTYKTSDEIDNHLADDPLAAEAIASRQTQAWVSSASSPPPEGVDYYQNSGIKVNLVIPIIYREELLALLSLQWLHPAKLQEDELKLIHLSAQQVALAITSTRSYQ
ncbi:response regulator [Oscillatoria salina]|uniref:response regulator n=1 Tax=Oscillatoria salina TaxID=331517 RepID=UPI001CCC4B21|nr:response regulator [Oscillatoria salina]MBZ8178922.1 response regulator [Oscillatoria salina IIICB1]